MKRNRVVLGILMAGAVALPSCVKKPESLLANDARRKEIIEALAANPAMRAEVIDRLIGPPESRAAVIDRVLKDESAAGDLVSKIMQQDRGKAIVASKVAADPTHNTFIRMNVLWVGAAATLLATIALPRSCCMILETRSPAADSSFRTRSITAARLSGGPIRRSMTSARIAGFAARASMISLRLASFARRLSGFLTHEGRATAPAIRIPRTTRLRFIVALRIQDARRPAPRGTPLFKTRSIYVPDGRDQA